MTLVERAARYKAFLNLLLSMGPELRDTLEDLQQMMLIVNRITDRFVRKLGYSAGPADFIDENGWQEITKIGEIATLEAQVKNLPPMAMASGGNVAAAPGDLIGLVRQIFEFLVANPQILTLLLAFFKKP